MALNKQVVKPIFFLFLAFFLVSTLIYFAGRAMHSRGDSALERSAYIVQYFVKVADGLNLDAKTAVPAGRVAIGEEAAIALLLRNLEEKTQRVEVEISPKTAAVDAVRIQDLHKEKFSLVPGQSQEIKITYSVLDARAFSRDGTLDFEIHISTPKD